MSAGSRCWQERAERLSEGLWSFSSRYEEIKSVKCHGLIKAGADFCRPVSCATLIKKTTWKCRLSAQLWVCAEELWVKADKSFLKWFNWDPRALSVALCDRLCLFRWIHFKVKHKKHCGASRDARVHVGNLKSVTPKCASLSGQEKMSCWFPLKWLIPIYLEEWLNWLEG